MRLITHTRKINDGDDDDDEVSLLRHFYIVALHLQSFDNKRITKGIDTLLLENDNKKYIHAITTKKKRSI